MGPGRELHKAVGTGAEPQAAGSALRGWAENKGDVEWYRSDRIKPNTKSGNYIFINFK